LGICGFGDVGYLEDFGDFGDSGYLGILRIFEFGVFLVLTGFVDFKILWTLGTSGFFRICGYEE
jgi:hypothetical protein